MYEVMAGNVKSIIKGIAAYDSVTVPKHER
jgi:hypothetical protein